MFQLNFSKAPIKTQWIGDGLTYSFPGLKAGKYYIEENEKKCVAVYFLYSEAYTLGEYKYEQ